MADTLGDVLPWPQARQPKSSTAAETTPGGREATRWVVVAANLNPGEAAIIKGRLQSEDIPALVQQEAVGSVLGLTVGPLGSARVLVPEPLAEQAQQLLAETFEVEDDPWPDDDFEDETAPE